MDILIIGGTGVISRVITAELLQRNHTVTLFNRGQRQNPYAGEVETIYGDKKNTEQFSASMQGRRFDAVIDMISYNRDDLQQTVRALGSRSGHLIICSTVSAYQRPFPVQPARETDLRLTDDPVYSYGYEKAKMEKAIQVLVREKNLPITIMRPSLTFGIGSKNIGVLRQNYNIVDRIRKGKPLIMFGDGKTSIQFSFAPDVAKGFAAACGNPLTFGKAYHVTSQEYHIWDDLYMEFGRLIGMEPTIAHMPTELLLHYDEALFGHLHFEKQFPALYDTAELRQDTGFEPSITLRQGLSMIMEWYEQDQHTLDTAKDQIEDQLVNLHASWMQQVKHLA